MHESASRAIFAEQTKNFSRIAKVRNWTIFSLEYPIVDVGFVAGGREIRIRMVCGDWDELPPSIELLSLSGEYLATLPKDPSSIFNGSKHPSTGRPFICMVGSREYHTHSSHKSDLWSSHKNKPGNDLGGILTKLWSAWMKLKD